MTAPCVILLQVSQNYTQQNRQPRSRCPAARPASYFISGTRGVWYGCHKAQTTEAASTYGEESALRGIKVFGGTLQLRSHSSSPHRQRDPIASFRAFHKVRGSGCKHPGVSSSHRWEERKAMTVKGVVRIPVCYQSSYLVLTGDTFSVITGGNASLA